MDKQKEAKPLPAKSISVEIEGNLYQINYPNNGQLIDIEALKINLSKGTIDGLLFARTAGSQLAYLTVEMIATFTVLIPQLVKDMRVDSFLDLTPLETKGLLKVFQAEYHPWFKEWYEYINEDFIKDENDEVEDAPASSAE